MRIFWLGEPAPAVVIFNDYKISKWVDTLVNVLPAESIDDQTFSREWTDVKFESVKRFFVFLFAVYLGSVFSNLQLILYTEEENGWAEQVYISWMTLFTIQSSIFEIIQCSDHGTAYFNYAQNYVEILQILFNTVFIVIRLSGFVDEYVSLSLIMICLSMVKL